MAEKTLDLEQLQKDLKAAQELLTKPFTTYTYKGKKYTSRTQIKNDLIPLIQSQIDIADAQARSQEGSLFIAEQLAATTQRELDSAYDAFTKGDVDEATITKLEQRLAQQNTTVESIKAGTPYEVFTDPTTKQYSVRPVKATPKAVTTTTTEQPPKLGPSPVARRAMTPVEGEPTPPPPPPPPPPPKEVPGAKPDQTSWVTNQLELRGLQDNAKNRKDLIAEYKKSVFKPLGDNWVEEFNKRFPTLGFLFTNPEFGPEVMAIAKKAVEEQWWMYPETAQALINREIANTPYGQRSSAKQETFDKKSQADQQVDITQKISDLQKTYGKLNLSDAEWQKIGYTAARNGLDDTLTQQKMLEFVYQKTPEGSYRYDTAVKAVEAGRLGQEVRKAYGDYFITPDESAIQDYATGKTTLEDIKRQARVLAGEIYPALKNMLDQGLTVKSVADQYASIAAETLEVPANTVNMMDPKFRVAFDVREGDKSRTMTIGEFQAKLKTDPNYGWQYTKSANQQAMDLATTIARAFGKVQ